MEMFDVNKELPQTKSGWSHDCYPVLILTNESYGKVSLFNFKICMWMNNGFQGYPSGATEVTHWCYLELPDFTEE